MQVLLAVLCVCFRAECVRQLRNRYSVSRVSSARPDCAAGSQRLLARVHVLPTSRRADQVGMSTSRPKEYVRASRDEPFAEFLKVEGHQLAPGVSDAEWLQLNPGKKKLHIGDQVFIPRTGAKQEQLQAHLGNVIAQANAAPFTTKSTSSHQHNGQT
ncbi:hypothetical protein ACK3TF_004855 [Chlorella vulgaris]